MRAVPLFFSFQHEADGHGEGHGAGTAVDDQRLVNPLPDGIDGSRVEERQGAKHPDPGDTAIDIGRRLEDDDALVDEVLAVGRELSKDA